MVFVGGKLSLKGDKKKSKRKKSKSKHDKKKSSRDEQEAAAAAAANDSNGSDVDEDEMTEAERKAQKYKQQAEKKDLEKVAKQSHRDRVEEYSQKLSQLTELNDIPRMSATCMWADAICVGVLGWKRQWDIFSVHRVLTAWLMLFCCFVVMSFCNPSLICIVPHFYFWIVCIITSSIWSCNWCLPIIIFI